MINKNINNSFIFDFIYLFIIVFQSLYLKNVILMAIEDGKIAKKEYRLIEQKIANKNN